MKLSTVEDRVVLLQTLPVTGTVAGLASASGPRGPSQSAIIDHQRDGIAAVR